jgi:hypothetical protein
MPSDKMRNLNPHKAARAAMYLYGKAYSQQAGGSMDFWDLLPEAWKNVCRTLVRDIEEARAERGEEKAGE